MKTVGCLLFALLISSAEAANSGTLVLRGHVPPRSEVKYDTNSNRYVLHSNAGLFALRTVIKDVVDLRGYRVVEVVPQ